MTKVQLAVGIVRTYRNFWLRFADYAGLITAGHDYTVVLRNGLRFAMRGGTSDSAVMDEVFVKRVYQAALDGLRPGSVVIDIGAQCGLFAVAAAARGAKVVACEPFKPNVPRIRQNAQLNRLGDRIRVNEVAVAGAAGTAELMWRENDTGGSTLYQSVHREWEGDPEVKRVTVPVVTLFELFKEARIDHCDCLKLDCEGAEYDIILNRPAELKKIGTVVLEYHPNGDVNALKEVLTSFGFQVSVGSDACTLYAQQGGHNGSPGIGNPARV